MPCTYSLTTKLDFSRLYENGVKCYPALLYALSAVVNRHEEFRTALDAEGNPGVFDALCPCYTVFHQESETFSNLWTPFCENYQNFLAAYQQDLAQYGSLPGFMAKPDPPENTFPISMIPWVSFDGFNLNLQNGFRYLLPIFTLGKFYQEGKKTLIPIAVQVHHAVCDGFHISHFLAELQELLFSPIFWANR